MVRPKDFGFNHQTASSNSFQNKLDQIDVLKQAQMEFDLMTAVLKEKQIEVIIFEDKEKGLPDSIFPNNWISHTANKLVVYPMQTKNRRAEVRLDVVDFFAARLANTEIIDLSKKTADSIFLEGTGSVIFDTKNKLAFAAISPRTNVKLLNELCALIGYQSISFESVDLNGKQIYHTNVMLSIADKFAVVCLASISDILERTLLKKAIEKTGRVVLDISYQQMNSFAANALEVAAMNGKSYYCLSKTAVDSLSNDQVAEIEKYTELLPISIPTIEKVGGGSVRCMIAGFFDYPK
jgi:hypothetical protein